jgi:hypothetical protein
MTIRYVGQNMLEWNMGGHFNFIEQYCIFVLGFTEPGYMMHDLLPRLREGNHDHAKTGAMVCKSISMHEFS